MIANYFTKPLQGKLFIIMRDQIMGISDTPIEERVGNCETTKKTIGVSPNMTEKKEISWADVVRRKETKGENNDIVRDKIVRSKSGG